MRILVTGGAGYIGSHTVQHLLNAGHSVTVFDNLSTGHADAVDTKRVSFFNVDLRDYRSVYVLLQEFTPDVVIHFAAKSIVAESMRDPISYYDNNIVGTLNLLRAMADCGVMNIVFSSTAAVYGEASEAIITENALTNPVNVYGHTKLAMERMIANLGFNYVALRYFNAAGAGYGLGERHEPETHLIPNLLKAVREDKPFQMYGDDYPTFDGTCIRDYIHVLDLAEAHRLAVEYLLAGHKSDTFNLGSGTGYSILGILKVAENVLQTKIKYEVAEKRAGDPAVLIASSNKIKTVLGWQPQYNIKDILESASKYRRTQRRKQS